MLFRSKWKRQVNHHTFDEINLHDFYNTSFRYVFGYLCMWGSIIISVAVLASDFYTAIVLLAFDRWSSNIQPKVPFHISKWIFGGCIILSVLLIIYNFIRAYLVAKTRNISFNYTNSIARDCLSIRHYEYFCLFAKITKSKSKVEYLALFVYFSLKGWVFLLITDAPRQVLNALTLYSVLKVQDDFIETVEKLGNEHLTEAIVVGFMAFSLLVWVIRMIMFITALLCCLPLYVHIEKSCSGLEEYCCTRIDRRIAKLVEKKHKEGMAQLKKENKKLKYQPTLPNFDIGENDANDYDSIKKVDTSPQLTTQKSNSTLTDNSPYNSSGIVVKRRDSFSSVVSSSSANSQSNLLPRNNPYALPGPRKVSMPLPEVENRYENLAGQTRRPSGSTDHVNRYAYPLGRNPFAIPPAGESPFHGPVRPSRPSGPSVHSSRSASTGNNSAPFITSTVPSGTARLERAEKNLPMGSSAQISRNPADYNGNALEPLRVRPIHDTTDFTRPPTRALGHNLSNSSLNSPVVSSRLGFNEPKKEPEQMKKAEPVPKLPANNLTRNGSVKIDPNGQLREPRVPSFASWDIDEN